MSAAATAAAPLTRRLIRVSPEFARFELERREMMASFAAFARGAWHIVEPERVYVHGWHLDALADHLEALAHRKIRNLVVNMPPRHSKSLMCSVFFPAWVWTWAPGQRFLYASYAESLALDHSVLTKRLVTSRWYQMRWGDKVTLRAGRKTMKRFENTSGGFRQATSVGGASTGKGGDFAFVDDAHSVQERESEAKLREVIDWWDQVMSTRGDDPSTFCRGIVMQRVQEGDLSGHVTEDPALGYTHLVLPARYEGKKEISPLGHVDPRSTLGEPLWKGRYDDEELKVLERALGPYGAAAQLQQRPAPEGGGIVRREWFRVYGSRVRDALLEHPETADQWLTVWDMKVKGSEQGSSYVVGAVWAKKGANAFLVYQYRAKVGFTGSCQAVRDTHEMFPWAIPIKIEAKANGPAVMDALEGVVPALEGVEPRGDKEARLHAVTPPIADGNVWVPDEEIAPWMAEFYNEVTLFPMAKTNDQVDCLSMALDILYLQDSGPPLGWYGKIMRTDFQTAPVGEQAAMLRAREEAAVRRKLNHERRQHPELFVADRDTTYTGANYEPPWETGNGGGG